jgi:hypothetical protein
VVVFYQSYSGDNSMSKERKLQIRNSTAEFLIFSKQAGEDSIEVRVENETVWLTQKLLALLFEADTAAFVAAGEKLEKLRKREDFFIELPVVKQGE